jgi:hypothetical protein
MGPVSDQGDDPQTFKTENVIMRCLVKATYCTRQRAVITEYGATVEL